ncbi:MAG: MaoC family dehydratase [Chloroflexi bacterium]|nr:MaoC family dehydratase [Chloroflexota bacterium]
MSLYEQLAGMVGEETGPYEANDEVNRAMIRHWCEAMEDGNPLYTDEAYAKKSKYGGIIAPPQMVQAYCVPRLWPKEDRPPDPLARSVALANEAGYFGVVATTTSQEHFAPMRPGDRLSYKIKLASVSPEKTTRMGTGFFITAEYTYTNQKGEIVCKQPFTIMKFKPAAPK